MIEPLRVKEIFVALKLHFTSDYNFVQYQGKVRSQQLKPEEFWFDKIGARLMLEQRVIDFFVANFVHVYVSDNRIENFAKNFCTKESFSVYRSWKKRQDNIYSALDVELAPYELKSLLTVEKLHPVLYRAFLSKKVSLETICCLSLALPKLFDYWLAHSNDKILLPQFCNFTKKYATLLSLDREKLVDAIKRKS